MVEEVISTLKLCLLIGTYLPPLNEGTYLPPLNEGGYVRRSLEYLEGTAHGKYK